MISLAKTDRTNEANTSSRAGIGYLILNAYILLYTKFIVETITFGVILVVEAYKVRKTAAEITNRLKLKVQRPTRLSESVCMSKNLR